MYHVKMFALIFLCRNIPVKFIFTLCLNYIGEFILKILLEPSLFVYKNATLLYYHPYALLQLYCRAEVSVNQKIKILYLL